MDTSCGRGMKVCTNVPGHMTFLSGLILFQHLCAVTVFLVFCYCRANQE